MGFTCCFEITRETLQCLLIIIVLLPLCEVSNTPPATKYRRPRLSRLHHILVKTYRKKHLALLPLLFLQSPFDLISLLSLLLLSH
jgi:hypothetical protein